VVGADRLAEVGEGDARADADVRVGDLDALEVADAVQEGDGAEVAVLRHPEAHVGRAAHERRVGVGGVPRGEVVGGFGCDPGGRGAVCPPLGCAEPPRGYLLKDEAGSVAHPVGDRRGGGGLGGADDGGVACAAAEVAGELVVVVGAAVEVGCCHRDDEARRAEAALRAVVGDHRLLHRMQLASGPGDAFHRADRLAVELRQEQDAGVERAGARLVRDHHRAGAAVAFVAAFLRAGEAARLAQPVEEGGRGVGVRQADCLSVEKKRDLHA
jgi:hypothetical protein